MSIFLHFHFCVCDIFSSSKFIKRPLLLGAFTSGFLLITILWSINVRTFDAVWSQTPKLLKICEKHTVKILNGPVIRCSIFGLSTIRMSQKKRTLKTLQTFKRYRTVSFIFDHKKFLGLVIGKVLGMKLF